MGQYDATAIRALESRLRAIERPLGLGIFTSYEHATKFTQLNHAHALSVALHDVLPF